MKKLSKEAKFNLKNIFGSLVSNKCAIEAAKSLPFWSSILVAILGVGLAIIPIVVTAANTNGSDVLKANYTYGVERKVAISSINLHNQNVRLEVDGNHYLTYYKNDVAQNDKVQGKELIDSHINSGSHEYEVMTYFVNEYDNRAYTDYINDTLKSQYIVGTTTPKGETDPGETKYYIPSCIFYFAKGLAIYNFKYESTTTVSSFVGDFVNVEAGELTTRFATVNGKMPTSIHDVVAPGYESGVLDNLKDFYNKSYLEIKGRNLLYSSTIYTSVYIGLILMLGLLIFAITRGKRNYNNYLKLYQCLYIAAWCSFTPGLLALIFGFIFANYSVMMFIMFMGVRTMWLTMKQLSPAYNG